MSKIKILPEILSNKIAAGEVVERPASVVKELVENALDAGSSRITVEVEAGGRSLIRVSDNGCGMNRDDALLALERYATSKIYTDDDLFSIQTLGFRGEALPSVASISKLSLISREADADAGTEVTVDGGRIRNVKETGAPRGTMITVRQLFFNTPARRKFLKTVNTEMGHITDTVAAIALGHQAVRFRLLHNGRRVRDWPAVEDGRQRAGDVLGSGLDKSLLSVDLDGNAAAVGGWIAPARVTRPTSRGLYVYVNGRFIRDRGVQRALSDAYSGRIMKGLFPVAVLFLTVPPDRVDVNVHPTKHEVRFADQRAVYDAVRRAAAAALGDSDRALWTAPDPLPGPARPEYRIREPRRLFSPKADTEPFAGEADAALGRSGPPETWSFRPAPAGSDPAGDQPGVRYEDDPPPPMPEMAPSPQRRFADLRVIGQLGNLYLLCEADDGMILIDQHAAHERVVFESLKNRRKRSGPGVQRLLVPETVDLDAREAVVMEKMLPDLTDIGLEMEPFGGNTFVVKAVPALLSGREVAPMVREIAGKLAETGYAPEVAGALDPVLILMACHSAIRAGQALEFKEMAALLKQLDRCDNPSHCPHGRPTWIRWRFQELEKMFKR
jgi:DNA mismatch repair protein MutL